MKRGTAAEPGLEPPGDEGSDAEHLLGAGDVALLELDHAGVAAVLLAAARGRRGRERGAGLAAGLQAHDLARARHLEALLRARVGLVLRHVVLSSSVLPLRVGRGGGNDGLSAWLRRAANSD